MRQMFSIGKRSALQAGQFSTFYYEAMLLYSCSIWFCIVLLKNTSSGGEHMLLLNLYLPYSIHSAFQIMPPAHTVWASNKSLRPCPLRTEISPVSLNLLMMLCTVEEIWRWGTLFLKYSTIFLRTLSHIGEPLPIFTSERLCFSKTSFLKLLM